MTPHVSKLKRIAFFRLRPEAGKQIRFILSEKTSLFIWVEITLIAFQTVLSVERYLLETPQQGSAG